MPPEFYDSPYFASLAAQYERIETKIPDHLWGSSPEPYQHLFRPGVDLPGVVVYRKRHALVRHAS